MKNCRYGTNYSDDTVAVTFDDIVDVNDFSNKWSYMFVGNQLRHYGKGVPMGDPLSCAKALGCTKHHEDLYDTSWHDSARNVSVCFMDDLFFQIGYDADAEGEGGEWTKESADDYIEGLKRCYPAPLELE